MMIRNRNRKMSKQLEEVTYMQELRTIHHQKIHHQYIQMNKATKSKLMIWIVDSGILAYLTEN